MRNEFLAQGMRDPLENPRCSYEAFHWLERPSTLDRGSSTTKTSQAVPTRAYQIDQPSFIASRALIQELE